MDIRLRAIILCQVKAQFGVQIKGRKRTDPEKIHRVQYGAMWSTKTPKEMLS